MEKHLNNSIQILLAIAISMKILENERKKSLRGSKMSFRSSIGPIVVSSPIKGLGLAKTSESLGLFDLKGSL